MGLEWGLKCRQEGGETGKGVLGSDGKGLEIKKGYRSLATMTSGSSPTTRLAVKTNALMSWVLLTGS